MSIRLGLVAVAADVDRLVEMLPAAWSNLRLQAKGSVASADLAEVWRSEHERFVSARDWRPDDPGVEVIAACQDGVWAVVLDPTLMLAVEPEALATLSQTLGRTLSFVIDTASGLNLFSAYEHGALLRAIELADGRLALHGTPLPEESGINLEGFLPEAVALLQQAFGLTPVLDQAGPLYQGPYQMLAVADMTDYSVLAALDAELNGSELLVQVGTAASAGSVAPANEGQSLGQATDGMHGMGALGQAPVALAGTGSEPAVRLRQRKSWWRFW